MSSNVVYYCYIIATLEARVISHSISELSPGQRNWITNSDLPLGFNTINDTIWKMGCNETEVGRRFGVYLYPNRSDRYDVSSVYINIDLFIKIILCTTYLLRSINTGLGVHHLSCTKNNHGTYFEVVVEVGIWHLVMLQIMYLSLMHYITL